MRTLAWRLLVVLVGGVWMSCDGCRMSLPSNDREARLRELAELDHAHWVAAEKRRWEMEDWWHSHSPAQRLYKKRFEGTIVPGVGCDACPRQCKVWDLRPMPPEELERRFRVAVEERRLATGDIEHQLATNEISRLGCIAAAAGSPLHEVLVALTSPRETFLLRLEAATLLMLHKIDEEAANVVIRQLRRDDDEHEADPPP